MASHKEPRRSEINLVRVILNIEHLCLMFNQQIFLTLHLHILRLMYNKLKHLRLK
jgi:hypothetical protein